MITGPNGKPVMSAEERRALIESSVPRETRIISPSRWSGIQTYPDGFERSLIPTIRQNVRTGEGNRVYGMPKGPRGGSVDD